MDFENLTKMQKLRIRGVIDRENEQLQKERVYEEILKDSISKINNIVFLISNQEEELVVIELKDKNGEMYYKPYYNQRPTAYSYENLDQGIIAAIALKNKLPEDHLGFVFKGFGIIESENK